MIRFEQVTKTYGGHSNALDDVTLTISPGEFLFLIGPSGAGKTTLLRMLMRELTPSSGKVSINDVDISTISSRKLYLLRRKIGMVFQDFKLLNDRTVFENIAIGLEISGMKRKDIAKRVDDILELVGLEDKKNLFPLQLAAGEMQRTSIARAVVGGPEILLADEPTGNLDPETSWEILDILEQVNKVGTIVIMATHNVSIVDDLRKRTIKIEKGKVTSDEEKGKYNLKERKGHKHGHS